MENAVMIVGNMTRDPELKFLNSGAATVGFPVAVNEKRFDQATREYVDNVKFFNVTAWNTLAENVAHSLKKGSRVVVVGKLNQRTWETDAGEKRHAIDIVADAVGPDLRFVTADIHRAEKASPAPGGFADEDPF